MFKKAIAITFICLLSSLASAKTYHVLIENRSEKDPAFITESGDKSAITKGLSGKTLEIARTDNSSFDVDIPDNAEYNLLIRMQPPQSAKIDTFLVSFKNQKFKTEDLFFGKRKYELSINQSPQSIHIAIEDRYVSGYWTGFITGGLIGIFLL